MRKFFCWRHPFQTKLLFFQTIESAKCAFHFIWDQNVQRAEGGDRENYQYNNFHGQSYNSIIRSALEVLSKIVHLYLISHLPCACKRDFITHYSEK